MNYEEDDINTTVKKLEKISKMFHEGEVNVSISSMPDKELIYIHHCIQQIYSGTNDLLRFMLRIKEKKE